MTRTEIPSSDSPRNENPSPRGLGPLPALGADLLIDWKQAANTAARISPAGPPLNSGKIQDLVADLRAKADTSVALVHQISGLQVAEELRDSPVLVVDRAGWAKANSQSFSTMLSPVIQALEEKRAQLSPKARNRVGKTLGTQLGGVLGFLATKVLGQYDPFMPGDTGAGRLLLVAPNIYQVEQELEVVPDDFRLWVCVHEQTHRVQFAAAPWLRGYMMDHIQQLGDGFKSNLESFGERLSGSLKSLTSGSSNNQGMLDLLQGPEEQAIVSQLTAVMSLLEGHANVVMDEVDTQTIPTVQEIRRKFSSRGKSRNPLEKFIRNFLGLDAKMRQYSDGARFVRTAVKQIGVAQFNVIWQHPKYLPTEAEIHDPAAWVRRMGY